MSKFLEFENTPVPSFKMNSSTGHESNYQQTVNATGLFLGKVIKVNVKKDSVVTYNVKITYAVGNSLDMPVTLYDCNVASLFGGIADFSYWKPRVIANEEKKDQHILGSNVLVLCISGNVRHGIIVGGYPNSKNKDPRIQKDDPQAILRYNGMDFEINKDGEFIATYNGATEANGELASTANKDVSGSFLKWSKDGRTAISSQGLSVGKATDKMLLASTYRDKEATKHKSMGLAIDKAVTGIKIAQAGAEVASKAIPFVSGPALQPIAIGLQQAASALLELKAALEAFEKDSPKYLSSKNLND